MPAPRRELHWVAPFLAALGRCGNVTRSAALAGVDVSGPYNRRNRDPEFREAWERVLAERDARAALDTPGAGGEAETQALAQMLRGAVPVPQAGEGQVAEGAAGVRLARAGAKRWSDRAEAAFLEELSASANVARAAAAAGF